MSSSPLSTNDQIEIEIRSLGSSGEGVGSHEGFTIFIEGALPGERVEVRITTLKRNYGIGSLIRVIEASKERVEPICPLFGRCGGCQLMHLSYKGQLQAKRQRVIDAMQRIGHLDVNVDPCVPSPQPLAYRNKMQLPMTPEGKPGLFRKGSHQVIEVDHCFIHCEKGEAVYKTIRDLLPVKGVRYVIIRSAVKTEQVLAIFVTDGQSQLQSIAKELMEKHPIVKGVIENINRKPGNRVLGSQFRTLAGSDHIEETICGLTFRVSAAAFFQVNPWQTETLYTAALDGLNLQPTDKLVDAYCGVGTLALIAANRVREVIGIECVPQAVEDATENASRNRIENALFECALAEKGLPEGIDALLLNPPRKGCAEALLQAVDANKLAYISCNPATLARDLSLLQAKGYKINRIQPFDMFPQTAHVETLALLSS